jgi:hypothetical protein
MGGVQTHPWEQLLEHRYKIEGLIYWRARMEEVLLSGHGYILDLLHAYGRVNAYREELAPEEWFWCPDCDGRGGGTWLFDENPHQYCGACSGTGILLTCEQRDPARKASSPYTFFSLLCRLRHLHEGEHAFGAELLGRERQFKRDSPIDGFIRWRRWLQSQLESGGRVTMGTVFAMNRMIPCRRKLAPADWIPCPECHERGLWMEDGRQHWCPRCYGTGILLVAELTDPAEIALCHRVSDHAKKGKMPPGQP